MKDITDIVEKYKLHLEMLIEHDLSWDEDEDGDLLYEDYDLNKRLYLPNFDFTSIDFPNLVEALLAENNGFSNMVEFRFAHLEYSIFDGLDLSRINFTAANLHQACLRGCNAREADFTRTILVGAKIEGTYFNSTSLTAFGVKFEYED